MVGAGMVGERRCPGTTLAQLDKGHNMTTYYGWIAYGGDLRKQAVTICNCLGHGSHHTAVDILIETAAAETGLGGVRDTTEGAGMGLTQFDELPFNDIKTRSMHLRDRIVDDLNIDISLVGWEDLRYNPFLALLFARLHYRLRSESIPADRIGRAKYWKKYYNTMSGAGTEKHFLKMCDKYLP